MAKFEPVTGPGFLISSVSDGSVWQLLPLGGAVPVKLLDGNGLTVGLSLHDSRSPGVGFHETVLAGANHREIWISGLQRGLHHVRAYDPEDQIDRAELFVNVVPLKTVTVACYFPPGVQPWDVDDLTRRANMIWKPANVTIKPIGDPKQTGDPGVRLPRQIELNEMAIQRQLKSLSFGNPDGADVLVYFLWTIADSSKRITNGETIGDMIVIDSFAHGPAERD